MMLSLKNIYTQANGKEQYSVPPLIICYIFPYVFQDFIQPGTEKRKTKKKKTTEPENSFLSRYLLTIAKTL
jgi:hypothetical protein